MTTAEMVAALRKEGYRVTKPRLRVAAPLGLNAVGKPYGANFDPNYKMRYRTPPLKRAQNIGDNYIRPEHWARICQLAQAQWDQDHKAAA